MHGANCDGCGEWSGTCGMYYAVKDDDNGARVTWCAGCAAAAICAGVDLRPVVLTIRSVLAGDAVAS